MTGLMLDTASVLHPRRSVSSIMMHVIAGLLPGIALYALLIDVRLLSNLLIAISCALIFEAVLLALRKRPFLVVLKDASVTLAAILLALSVPQSLPAWQLVFGVFILCTVGKHVFGGLGHNPFNPAMVAYAVLIISFPLTMTQWSSGHGLLDTPQYLQQTHNESDKLLWDSVTGATPLDRLDTLRRNSRSDAQALSDDSITKATLDANPNRAAASTDSAAEKTLLVKPAIITDSDWFWLSIAWLFGGTYLLLMRIITWQIPVSILTTLWCLYAVSGWLFSAPILPATAALFSGAIMLGAFFIATDPVSAATSNPGKLVYGVGIGVLCFIIREYSAYPEGLAFAVLLMNMCVPLIDHAFTRNSLQGKSSSAIHDRTPPS